MSDRRLQGDAGSIVVLVAAGTVALLVVVAIVVDLGFVRDERRSHQAAADFAALAAGEALGWDPAPDGQAGCAAAVRYLRANVGDLPDSTTVPCTSLPATCTATTSPTTVTDGGTGGRFDIEITFPVSDAAIADGTVADAAGLRTYDGLPCERIMIRLVSSVDSFFASVVGKDTLEIDAEATVRQVQSSDRRVPSLWLLEPYECNGLVVTGGSTVTVGNAATSGLITLDTDGSACTGSQVTIDASGTGSNIHAIPFSLPLPPQITLVAMERLQTTCVTGNPYACEGTDVAGGTLWPQPEPRTTRATRAPIDHQYNCKSSYPDYLGIPIDGCSATSPAHIDDLRTLIGTSGTPAGYQRWTDFYGCNNPSVPAGGLTGNWHVDCANFRLTSNTVNFNDGNVVFDNNIILTGGTLGFNQNNLTGVLPPTCHLTVVTCLGESSPNAAWVFQRAGYLRLSGGSGLNASRTMIYQHDGDFEITGGSPPHWSAPIVGPFAGLAVWSEADSAKYKISGGASMVLEGTFFTPFAKPMSISGGAPVSPLQAQFVARTLEVNGGASINLSPNATLAVVLPPDPPLLIR